MWLMLRDGKTVLAQESFTNYLNLKKPKGIEIIKVEVKEL
jgi:hypothetical protein